MVKKVKTTVKLGYKEQIEHTWMLWVILRVYLPTCNEHNPVIMNKIRLKGILKGNFKQNSRKYVQTSFFNTIDC